GIYLHYLCNNNTLINNNVSNIGEGNDGIYIFGSDDVFVADNTVMGKYRSAITLYNSLNTIVLNQDSSGGNRGLTIWGSNNSIIRDCINLSGNMYDLDVPFVDFGPSINNTLINCSYNLNKERVEGDLNNLSNLTRKWYYQAYVNNTEGSPLSNANIAAYNSSGQLQFTTQTNSSGYIPRQEVTEYVNKGGTKVYQNPQTVNVTKSGYLTNSTLYNLTRLHNVFANIVLEIDVESETTYPEVTINSPIGTIADVTPLINISVSKNVNLWYNLDGGENITLCEDCNSSQDRFLYIEEGGHIIYVFANDSFGNLNSSVYSSFTIDMNNNYYDDFNDNSSIFSQNNIIWNKGNMTFSGDYNYLSHPNLISVYKFENSGNLGLDTKYNNNMSTVGDPAQSSIVPSGKTGYSIELDGNDQTCIRSGFTFDPSADHTMCFWVMKTNFAGEGNVFAQHCVYDTWDEGYDYLFTANNCYNGESASIANVFSLNQWVHICQKYNSTTRNMTFYINGNENSSHVLSNPIQYHSDQAWCIGGCDGGCWMTGNVFEPMWFDEILSSNEISSIYSNEGRHSSGNFTSYAINTTENITEITNITWTEINTDANNNITVQVSVDGGLNWHTAISGSRLGQAFTGEANSLVYRVIFTTNSSTTIGISDINISWSSEEPDTSYPTITFQEPPTPTNASTVYFPNQSIVANISDNLNTSSWIDFDRSLVSYWSMDYYNATGIIDNSTYNNLATFYGGINGANTLPGARGRGLKFDGVNDSLKVNPINLSNTNEISVSFWFNPTSAPSSGNNMIMEMSFHMAVYQDSFFVNFQGDGNISAAVGGDVGYSEWFSSTKLNNGNWYHVVVVFDKSLPVNETKIYINGKLDGVPSEIHNSDNTNNFGNRDIYIGSRATDTEFLNGSLDEVMLFNRALSETEILALYNSQSNLFNTTLYNLQDGKHNYTVYAINEAGNYRTSGQRNFIVDTEVVGGNTCGELNSPNTVYTLTQNVSSQGTCFTVTQPNITLDCNGYWINYTGNDIGYYFGIQTNQFNTTVRNCNIYNYTAGIFFNGADNGTIENNNITIYNNKSLDSIIYDNTWRLTPRASGILIHDSANYNTIVNNTAYSYYGRGIYINDASNNIIKNSNGSSYFNPGIQVFGGVSHTGLNNSIINSFGLSEESNGIRLGYYGHYNSIINSTAISNLEYAILADYGEFTNVINSLGNSSSRTGIYFLGIINGNIINSTGFSNLTDGIEVTYSSHNNLISNSTGIGYHTGIVLGGLLSSYPSNNNTLIDSNGTGGIAGIRLGGINNTIIRNRATGENEAYHLGSLNDSRIIDCVYTSGNLQDVYVSSVYLSVNNTFLNCSYDTEEVNGADGQIIRKWYYQAYTNYSNGTEIAGANISAYNSTGDLQFTTLTNSSGYIDRQEVTEYVNRGGTRSYYNNYIINATSLGYETDS
ncbi:MAG: hypothetical protein GX660_05630, partial [Clostridiaceae bacterium]|nr:hypothetical protein [Clostridiaceae bacterium]